MTTNCESQEYRRRDNSELGVEHPRASSSDDVECFFSILNERLGRNFTIKNLKDLWIVTCQEFSKRIDPDLPFYYHTSGKSRYRTTDLPSFDEGQGKPTRLDSLKPSRREHEGRKVIGRSTMIARGGSSLRQTFHVGPLSLPFIRPR